MVPSWKKHLVFITFKNNGNNSFKSYARNMYADGNDDVEQFAFQWGLIDVFMVCHSFIGPS